MKRKSTSKKDALLASTAKAVTIDKGELKEVYAGQFHGSVSVSSPKGDEVIYEAAERIKKINVKKADVELAIWQRAFTLTDVKSQQYVAGPSVFIFPKAIIEEGGGGGKAN